MRKGKIICLEGTDGSGKETQTKLLVEKLLLENVSIEFMSFPSYETPSGKIVGECYLGKNLGLGTGALFGDSDKLDARASCLYYAANRRFALPHINKVLNEGTNIIFDRYVDSNKAHQGGKIEDIYERKNLIDYIDKLEYDLLELPRPDITIFLYLPSNYALKKIRERADKKGEILDGHESSERHIRGAEKVYLELSKKYSWERINCLTMEGKRKRKEETAEEVYFKIKKFLNLEKE